MDKNRLDILFVGDDPGDVRLPGEILKEACPIVLKTAHAGRLSEALEIMAGKAFDIVLLDLDLPDGSGLAGLERIAAAHPAAPVIVFTGPDDEGTGLEALRKNAGDYLVKGRTDGKTLARSILCSIERKKKETELVRANRILKTRNDNDQAVISATDEYSYLEEACGRIASGCGDLMVWVGYADEKEGKTIKPVACSGFEGSCLRTMGTGWTGTGSGHAPECPALRGCEQKDFGAMLADPLFRLCGREAARTGRAASISVALTAHNRVFGALTIYAKGSGPLSESEERMFSELANDLASGITAIRWRSALARIIDALRDSEERYRVLADTSPDAILVHRGGALLYANPSALRLYRAETFGQLASRRILDLINPEDSDRSEARVRLMDGREIIVETAAAPIVYQGERAVQAVIRDITERVRASEIIKRDKRTLEELIGAKAQELLDTRLELEKAKRLSDIGTLAATVAHELRNPLAAISMAASNIKRKADTQLIGSHLRNIDKKIVESNQIINNLLFYSRLKMPQFELVNITAVLEECVSVMEAMGARGARTLMELKIPPSTLIRADPLQMKEVFSNILNNARDAASSDTPGEIRVSASGDAEFINVRIEDTGAGIEKKILDRIFEPFFTTKPKGTGLGLYICRQIINLHNGGISVESEPGKRTVFSVNLPKDPKNGRKEISAAGAEDLKTRRRPADPKIGHADPPARVLSARPISR
jgi:signal transduction histidine kinase/DNA-binding NarL/FixJ family response regulator